MVSLFKKFLKSERSGGLLLIVCTVISLIIANSGWGNSYQNFWQIKIGEGSIEHWINDGLMAVFFLLIGLELKREIYTGELSKIKKAALPVFAAVGGMIIPAGIYLLINAGTATQSGAGIPMATDIAFALGILSLVGNKIPIALKVFLTALAVIDDLGAILVIAVFYSKALILYNLVISLGIWILLLILNRLKVTNAVPYLLGGVFMWWFMLHSGVHATITGILLAFAMPFGNGKKNSTSYKLHSFLHVPVAFIILPLFALANTAISIHGVGTQMITAPYSMGIALGLIVGKPVGILLFSFLAVKLKAAKLPHSLNWKLIAGTGLLGGIGFTMSIFITLLAFNEEELINHAKLVILVSSLVAGILGFIALKFFISTSHKQSHATN